MAFEAMFQPIQIGKLTIRNRVLSTAHAEVYATDGGMTTDRYVKYYEEKAKGGIGLAICGGSSVVAIDSPQEWWASVNLSTDRIIPHFQNLADAMHKHGAKIMIQITHMGRRSRWDGFNWPTLMSPSGIREPVHRATCKTIEPEEIWRVIGNYAQAARRAKAGGLDGVELSAVHQHMIDQFWSPRVNKRTDEWGGTFEGRMKFGLEVLKAVRAEVGPDFCVGMRICGDEFHPDGLSHEDMKEIAKYYDDTGMLDFIGVVGSGCDTHNTLANVIPNMSYPPEPFLHLAAGIKEVVKVPVLHAQNIKDPNQATRILEGGYVDMVGMTRAHIADPHLIAKIKMGQVDQIKQCVGANYCIDRQYQGLDVLCIQNAATSREYMGVPHIIEKTTGVKRKVVVVGAGPAGMEAARVAAERGHDVTLFEKRDQIGGQITIAAKAPQRDQIAGITRWYQLELARLKVDLRLGTAADVAAIQDLRPDVIVLATPEIAGMPYVVSGLVAAGGLAAALSTADGLLLTITSALSHDVYYRIIRPDASTQFRLVIAKSLLLVVAVLAATVAAQKPGTILSMVAWAFSIAGSAFFPALVLGIFWARATRMGALAGMVVGVSLSLYYILRVEFDSIPWLGVSGFKMEPWFHVQATSAGLFGVVAGFATIIIVSLLTKPEPGSADFLGRIRLASRRDA